MLLLTSLMDISFQCFSFALHFFARNLAIKFIHWNVNEKDSLMLHVMIKVFIRFKHHIRINCTHFHQSAHYFAVDTLAIVIKLTISNIFRINMYTFQVMTTMEMILKLLTSDCLKNLKVEKHLSTYDEFAFYLFIKILPDIHFCIIFVK